MTINPNNCICGEISIPIGSKYSDGESESFYVLINGVRYDLHHDFSVSLENGSSLITASDLIVSETTIKPDSIKLYIGNQNLIITNKIEILLTTSTGEFIASKYIGQSDSRYVINDGVISFDSCSIQNRPELQNKILLVNIKSHCDFSDLDCCEDVNLPYISPIITTLYHCNPTNFYVPIAKINNDSTCLVFNQELKAWSASDPDDDFLINPTDYLEIKDGIVYIKKIPSSTYIRYVISIRDTKNKSLLYNTKSLYLLSHDCPTTTTTTTPEPCDPNACPRLINPECFHVHYKDVYPCNRPQTGVKSATHIWDGLRLSEWKYSIYVDSFEYYDRVVVYYNDPVTGNQVTLYDTDNVTHQYSDFDTARCCEDFGDSPLIDSFMKPFDITRLVIEITTGGFVNTLSAVVVAICPYGEDVFLDSPCT